ncbi:tumor necrosis factor alpha-induced protein 2 [Rhinophrynus dorsalis]
MSRIFAASRLHSMTFGDSMAFLATFQPRFGAELLALALKRPADWDSRPPALLQTQLYLDFVLLPLEAAPVGESPTPFPCIVGNILPGVGSVRPFCGFAVFMRNIIKKMMIVEDEHSVQKENISAQNAVGGKKKKGGIYKRIKDLKNYLYPKQAEDNSAEPENVPEPITAETIQEHILQKRFWKASKDLIIYEQELYSKTDDQQDKIVELCSLYGELEAGVFQVIKDSIKRESVDLLEEAVQAIVEQEIEDSRYLSDSSTVKVDTARPRQWKQKWIDNVKQSVDKRMTQLPEVSKKDSISIMSQTFAILGKTFKKDLIHVVMHLKQHYPAEFDVCNTYAQQYHQHMLSQINSVTEFELGGKDTHFLLCWVHNIYPNTILKDPSLAGHIDETRLESLLPQDKIREFEHNYVPYEVETVKRWISKSLDLEVDRWKEGKEPEKLGNYYHTELPIDVIQSYNGGLQRAAEISQRLTRRISPLLEYELVEFLRRYKSLFEEYKEKNKTQQHFMPIVIANINCCRSIREFVERSDAQSPFLSKEKMNHVLLEFEELAYDVLLQNLFQELKSLFRKLSQGNGLCSYQVMSEIIKKTEKYISPLTTLNPPCYQDMIDRIHLYLVKEYITRLMKKKVSYKNLNQLQTLANQIHENAKMINEFCSSRESRTAWMNPVISKLAEIIRLQDLNAIQLEVGALVGEYADIGKKHIEAILYIKGNLSRQEVKSILSIINISERKDSPNPPLFSLIKPS